MSSRNLEEIHKYAEREFKNHAILEEPDGTFFVGNRNGSYTYAFWIRIHPKTGSAFLWGDLGSMHIRMGHKTLEGIVGWIRSSVRDPHYFFEKVQANRRDMDPCKVYSQHEAEATIKRWEEEDPDWMTKEKADKMREAIAVASGYPADISHYKVHEAWWEILGDAEGMHATDWDFQCCWQLECFALFGRLYYEMKEKEAAEPPLKPGSFWRGLKMKLLRLWGGW